MPKGDGDGMKVVVDVYGMISVDVPYAEAESVIMVLFDLCKELVILRSCARDIGKGSKNDRWSSLYTQKDLRVFLDLSGAFKIRTQLS
jgi:hypothetical protein